MFENSAAGQTCVNNAEKSFSVITVINDQNDRNLVFNCFVCQSPCEKCKSLCVTCKSPCQKCAVKKSCKNSCTDTDDFDKYFENQFKKAKIQPKFKAVGVDTYDLDSHFDYYNLEKQAVRIQKSVATDCADLNLRRLIQKKSFKNTIATDTSDLLTIFAKPKENESSNYKSPIKKQVKDEFHTNGGEVIASFKNSYQIPTNKTVSLSFNSQENSSVEVPSICQNINDQENLEGSSRDVTFDTSSDESDIDLLTSSKLSKSKELAKKHKITLKQINTTNGFSFKCTICKKIFRQKHLGTLHLGNHIENNKYKCLACTELFNSINTLLNHVNNNHLEDLKSNECFSDSDKSNENKKEDEKLKIQKVYQCALCSSEGYTKVQFDSCKALSLHKKSKHGVGSPRAVKNKNMVEKKMRIRQEFICLICGKQFKSSKALKDHSPVHTGEKNYLCEICNKSYTTNANLKIHKRTHTGARNFVCSVCNKAFHKKDSLKVHFRKHSGERPFQCDLCPMRFDRNYILKNHRYTHFSEKTFICPFCGKTFTTHGGLNNHEKSHKKDPFVKKPRKPAVKPTLETENAVICDVCGKIYSTKSNLRIHKFVHLGIKPFECRVCHQSYAKKDSMLTHMRKHFDDRPFSCETCGMKFYRNHTLKTHLLRHTGEKPHKCKICGKSFTQSSSLAYHIKNHDKKLERKTVPPSNDSVKPKKKKIAVAKSQTAKVPTIMLKTNENFHNSDDSKELSDRKKAEKIMPDLTIPVNLPERDLEKGSNILLPTLEKEIFILDKNLTVELARSVNVDKEMDSGVEKDGIPYNGTNVAKFNYYVAKSQIFSVSKDAKERLQKAEEALDNLSVSKNNCIIKEEESLIEINKETGSKNLDIKSETLNFKPQTVVPMAGEILNATFINDECSEVIPLGPMTIHNLNSDNIMISPIIAFEGNGGGVDDRKNFLKGSKLAVFDSKMPYHLPISRAGNERSPVKSTCHVINLKDTKIPQKIQIELDSASLQIQGSINDTTLQEISEFYNGGQQNEL